MKIAVLGGTGALGSGLAKRWAAAGHTIVIGSRDADKARAAAAELAGEASGATYASAAAEADVVVLTVPFSGQIDVLEGVRDALQGKVLIDTTVPLVPPKVSRVQLPPEGSAAMRAQIFLGEGVRVVSAFQNVGARHLHADYPIDCDVLVSGDAADAVEQALELVADAGLTGVKAGGLVNAAAAEALTSILIHINRVYKVHESGIRITGLTPAAH